MRIMHMILSRGFAGSERSAAQMANVQCEEHEVAIVLKRKHAKYGVSITQWLDPRVQVFTVGKWFTTMQVSRVLKSWQPDVIHAHLRRSTKILARIRPPCPTIVTLHIAMNGSSYEAMDGMICIAQWQRADIPPGYDGRVYHIAPGYSPHRRLAANEIAALRRELNVAPHELLIGGVGRLTPTKGFDLLIAAFRRAGIPDSKLVILGEGRERRRLEQMAGPNISLPGFRANIKDYYQAFDIFVCPSRDEPFGLVLLEALDAGVPVIASAAAGPREVLDEHPGELFPVEDVESLTALLKQYGTSRAPRMPRDLSRYSMKTIARQTEEAYLELLSTAR